MALVIKSDFELKKQAEGLIAFGGVWFNLYSLDGAYKRLKDIQSEAVAACKNTKAKPKRKN